MNHDLLENLRNHTFYHGTSLEAAESIAQSGFQVWFEDEEIGHCARSGNHGNGIYLTCNWRTALWFGPTLLRVEIRSGTRLLNAALPTDDRVISYLRKEFGFEILKKPPRKVLPKNKRLKTSEMKNLVRYHYWRTWEKTYGTGGDFISKWTTRRELHRKLIHDFRSLIIRYGFHGFGNPVDHNGIVIFDDSRLYLKAIVTHVPSNVYSSWSFEDSLLSKSIS